MKKITLILFLFIIKSSFAQGNLQFNQVIILENQAIVTNTSGETSDSIEFVIPTNKVWKIESATASRISIGSQPQPNSCVQLYVDNMFLYYGTIGNFNVVSFPFWLPSGNHKFRIELGGACGGINSINKGYLSII